MGVPATATAQPPNLNSVPPLNVDQDIENFRAGVAAARVNPKFKYTKESGGSNPAEIWENAADHTTYKKYQSGAMYSSQGVYDGHSNFSAVDILPGPNGQTTDDHLDVTGGQRREQETVVDGCLRPIEGSDVTGPDGGLLNGLKENYRQGGGAIPYEVDSAIPQIPDMPPTDPR